MGVYPGVWCDNTKGKVQRQLFENGLTELLTEGSRVRMPEPNLEKGTKKLNRNTDRVRAHTPLNVVYEQELKSEVGIINNAKYLLSIAKKLGANSYTIGTANYSVVIRNKGKTVMAETRIPIVFYKSSRV